MAIGIRSGHEARIDAFAERNKPAHTTCVTERQRAACLSDQFSVCPTCLTGAESSARITAPSGRPMAGDGRQRILASD